MVQSEKYSLHKHKNLIQSQNPHEKFEHDSVTPKDGDSGERRGHIPGLRSQPSFLIKFLS